MINEKSLQAIQKAHFEGDLCKPLYDSYCFSRIPATLRAMFTGEKRNLALPADAGGLDETADFVVLLLLDGFGWRFFEQFLPQSPFLRRFAEEGIASKLTSQFPSTTTAHVTCLNTGLDVGQSGLYEWFSYEPGLQKIIAPLLCSFAGDKEPCTLEKAGVFSPSLYPSHTFYEDLRAIGINTFALQSIVIAHSPYSQAMFRGATYLPFHSISDGLEKAVDLYHTCPKGGKHYVYLYISDIDSIGHRQGPSSPEYARIVVNLLNMLEKQFFEKLKGRKEIKAACLLTADHGMIEIVPEETLYLNREVPSFEKYIARNDKGELLVPAGSCRDFFLHIRPEYLDEAKKVLEEWLGKRAMVMKTDDLISRGFFGSQPPSERFRERVGNLVILPRGNHSVWWYEKDRFEQHFKGMHGGLSCAEMEIPFLYHRF